MSGQGGNKISDFAQSREGACMFQGQTGKITP